VVAVAKKHKGVRDFFDVLSTVTNVVCGSCKRKDILRESHKETLVKEIEKGEIETGKGKNQEVTLARAGDTRWGSHHRTITSLIKMFSDVLKVLHYVEEEGDTISNRGTASGLIKYFKTLDFVFLLYLLLHILGLTNTLSRHLQKSDQTILEAVALVKGTKRALQEYRATGFASLLKNVTSFCGKHDIEMVNMGDFHSRGRRDRMTNQHHFELVKLSEMYPREFTYKERLSLPTELGVYYQIVRNDTDFTNLDSIAKLAKKMMDKKKHTSHPLVYRWLKLALVLPIATATVSAISYKDYFQYVINLAYYLASAVSRSICSYLAGKDTQVPQPSGSTDIVTDEAVHKELSDSLVRAATTASSLEAEQDNGNITKTRSKATPNESSSLGTTSGGGLGCQETMGNTIAQTSSMNLSHLASKEQGTRWKMSL
ncbi:zinc finger MYM-type protein 1-like protein, partial [Tanacetum coccineum]